jgi:voltage-gated potassium channel
MPDTHVAGWRHRLHEIVFEADTPSGRAFDITLLVAIIFSVATVMLESVSEIQASHSTQLVVLEWFFTLLFTVEYVVRLLSVGRPSRYAFSFFGVTDLLSILPTYLSVIFSGGQSLLIVRVFRLLRIFRVLKLRHYLSEAQVLEDALRGSRLKITVFVAAVASISIVMGALMYLIEGPSAGFTSIPRGVYWAIVTMTTVGYGNIAPITPVGQLAASCLMILGYAIIAVPTGIVSVAIAQKMQNYTVSTQACLQCGSEGHAIDAQHCKHCGANLGTGHYPGPAREA